MIFFLYGEDSFRSYERVLEIKDRFKLSDKSNSGLSSFDAEEKKSIFDEFMKTYEMPSLFSPKRLLVIKKAISAASSEEQKKLLDFLKGNAERLLKDEDWIVVFWESGMPKKNNALFKFLEHNAKKQNFEGLSGVKLEQWAMKKLKSLNAEAAISKDAIRKLLAYAGNDTAVLSNEIEKLFNHSHPDMISEEAVDTLVKAKIDSNIFETIDAIASGNKKKALALLHKHLEKDEDPFYLFSMFVYQFRNLIRVNDALESRVMQEAQIAKMTHLHPYVVKKSLMQARNFGSFRLKSLYQKLSVFDLKIKTGTLDIRLALDKFIAEI